MPITDSNPPADIGEDYMDDDLFDYDAEIPDIDTLTKVPDPHSGTGKGDNLGIDEEVKIRKKRVVVKLDEERLMSNLGIPKLRQDAPKKLKFKGKGYEYRDTARLLSYYQFWADDLYKKAKFRDTLKIIEKLGHSRSMRDQRLSWIEETKRKEKLLRDGGSGDNHPEVDTTGGESRENERVFGDNQDDSDLYSLPQQRATGTEVQRSATGELHTDSSGALFLRGTVDDSDDDDFGAGPNDDELDAMIDMERAMVSTVPPTKSLVGLGDMDATAAANLAPPDDFEDEMQAMADLGPPPDW